VFESAALESVLDPALKRVASAWAPVLALELAVLVLDPATALVRVSEQELATAQASSLEEAASLRMLAGAKKILEKARRLG
jgi:hypothetical protein